MGLVPIPMIAHFLYANIITSERVHSWKTSDTQTRDSQIVLMLEPKPSPLSFRVLVFYSGSGVMLTPGKPAPGMWRRESCSPAAQQVQGQHKLHQRFCLKSPRCASKDPSLLCSVLSTFLPVCSSHPAMKPFFSHSFQTLPPLFQVKLLQVTGLAGKAFWSSAVSPGGSVVHKRDRPLEVTRVNTQRVKKPRGFQKK